MPGEGFERGVLFGEERIGLDLQVFEELHGLFAFVRHAVVQDEVGEIRKAEQPGFLPAQFENAGEQGAIVAIGLGGTRRKARYICSRIYRSSR